MKTFGFFGCGLLLAVTLLPAIVWGQDFEQEPILYGKREPKNRISQLMDGLRTGEKKLEFEPHFGYLRSLLKELEVPQASQVLVYSKTSLQRQRIAPKTPRALYFSDDVYIGFCQHGEVLEISVADPELGGVFYTLEQESDAPRITRQMDNCLICHGSSTTKGVPGHLVRSVYTDAGGFPVLSMGTYRTDHTSPLEQRWGGWYVTGTHGEQKHLGNLIVRTKERPEEIDNSAGQNIAKLDDRFDTSRYLTPHSDLIALMVLEHQADAHNYITQANFSTRQAIAYEIDFNNQLGKGNREPLASTNRRIKSACEPLVEYLFFAEEAKLTQPLVGTSPFAAEFPQKGPRDKKGRSLRDLDLQTRMFKYPCSYLVYSEGFRTLPPEAKSYVMHRMWEVLSGQDQSKKFSHLTAEDRTAIREILLDTLPDLPEEWKRR
ncbi:MAG: hypothetical protein ACO1RA_17095 [Planctomycetaceae bacterium]